MTRSMPIAKHLADYSAGLDRLAALQKDWDSYDSDPIPVERINMARGLLAWMAENHPDAPGPDAVVPMACGGVSLEWQGEKQDVHVDIEDDTELLVFTDCRVTRRQTINPDCPICREQVVAAVEGI